MLEQGLIQVYSGDGKGKTSAALGAVLRGVGQGLRACVVQFMKKDESLGEIQALRQEPLAERVAVFQFGRSPCGGKRAWVDPENLTPEDLEQARAALECGRKAINSGYYDLVVLDEVNLAAAWKLVDLEELLTILREKPAHVELILTGRSAPAEILEAADLVTQMFHVKHPAEKGVCARQGIEY